MPVNRIIRSRSNRILTRRERTVGSQLEKKRLSKARRIVDRLRMLLLEARPVVRN